MFFAFLHDVKIIILGGRDQSQLSGKCRIQLFEMAILRPGANTEVSFFVFFFFPLPFTVASGVLNLDYGSQKG